MKKLLATGLILAMASPAYCQQKDKDLVIKTSLANAIYQYLMEKPIKEVRGLVQQLEKLKPIPELKNSEKKED